MRLDNITPSDNIGDRRSKEPEFCWTNHLFDPPEHLCKEGQNGRSYPNPKYKPQSSTKMDKEQSNPTELLFDNIYTKTVTGKG